MTVSVDPSKVHALKNLGGCLLQLGRFEEAGSVVSRSDCCRPSGLPAYSQLLSLKRCA